MPLSLRIENVDQLPDGGPVTYTVDKRGLDIGRDPFMDWTLPDQQRFISGTHCHIRYENGGYWVHDVSTNGTMLNGQDRRITEPYKLISGDRLYIGGYIIVAEITGEEPVGDAAGTGTGGAATDPWGVEGAADPVDRRQFQRESAHPGYDTRPVSADLPDENIGWAMDVGGPARSDPSELDWSVPTPGSGGGAPDPGNIDWGTPQPDRAGAATPDWTAAAPAPDAPGADGPAADWRAPPPEPGAAGPVPAPGAFDTGAPVAPTPAPGAFDTGAPVAPTPAPGAFDTGAPVVPTPARGAFDTGAPPGPTPAPGGPVGEPAPRPEAFGAAPEQPGPAAGASQTPTPRQAEVKSEDEPLQLVNPVSVPDGEPHGGAAARGAFIAAFERGAGLPAGAVATKSDEEFAEELGRLLHMTAQNLQAMLHARQETKSAIRSSEVTSIAALENNPLKFSPSVEDAMKIMFGEKTRSYLDAQQTVEQSFGDLQRHQLYTFNAMQQALTTLIDDLDPERIAGDTSEEGGLAGLVSSRRAKLWDTYVERFRSKSSHQRGMVGTFMLLFAEMYDRQG